METELIQGDCLEKMRGIPNGGVDMILTDPPYGTTACKWDSVIPFEQVERFDKFLSNVSGRLQYNTLIA